MLEIDGDAIADRRLDLPDAPVRSARVPHPSAWFKKMTHQTTSAKNTLLTGKSASAMSPGISAPF